MRRSSARAASIEAVIVPPVPVARSLAAREAARRLIASAYDAGPALFATPEVDLVPAAEQALFHAFRSLDATGIHRRPPPTWRAFARLAYGFGSGLLHRRLPVVRDRVVVVVLNPAHREILKSVAPLVEATGMRLALISDGSGRSATAHLPGLAAFLRPTQAPDVLSRMLRADRAIDRATREWSRIVDERTASMARETLRAELLRAILDAACFDAIAAGGPRSVVTFDEIGRRARLVRKVVARRGVASLDLPHAEAADPLAIAGADYDLFGVFGPRARMVVEAAGIASTRIREVGAARFDELVLRPVNQPVLPRRLVFASQWLGGQMTAEVKAATIRLAVEAAAAAAPCTLVVKPHPLETDRIADEVLGVGLPADVIASVDRQSRLYDLLDGAWGMLTGWSNVVFESNLSGVPAVCLTATGGPDPTSFVPEGLAVGASDGKTVVAAMARLADENERASLLAGARAALGEHLGPLDGRASERTAALIAEMSSR